MPHLCKRKKKQEASNRMRRIFRFTQRRSKEHFRKRKILRKRVGDRVQSPGMSILAPTCKAFREVQEQNTDVGASRRYTTNCTFSTLQPRRIAEIMQTLVTTILSFQKNRKHPVAFTYRVRHAIQNHSRQREKFQRVWPVQWFSNSHKRLGFA